MTRQRFCLTCQRTVYRSERDSDSCPVCSGPLVEEASALAEAEVDHNQTVAAFKPRAGWAMDLSGYFLG